jgi:glutathione S-transferase
MMSLRSAPASPFVRKVRIAAALAGLADQIELVFAETSDPEDSLRNQNPLGKIPALILASGEVLFDSRVIVEYFDWLAVGGKLIPPPGAARFATLTRAALADGIADAAVLLIYEQRWREPHLRSEKWRDHQAGKIARALAEFESAPPALAPIDIGAVALACSLGYLDLRFAGAWREDHPKLVAWLEKFAAAVPAFAATRFKG